METIDIKVSDGKTAGVSIRVNILEIKIKEIGYFE